MKPITLKEFAELAKAAGGYSFDEFIEDLKELLRRCYETELP